MVKLAEIWSIDWTDVISREIYARWIPRGRRADYYHRFAAYDEDGLSFTDCLNQMVALLEERKNIDAKALGLVNDEMAESGSISKAIGKIAPAGEVQFIEVGLKSGNLADGFRRAAGLIENQAKYKSIVKSKLLMPFGLIVAILLAIAIGGARILPMFKEFAGQGGWSESAETLYVISGFLNKHLLFVLAGLVGLSVLLFKALPHWSSVTRTRFLDHKIPPFNVYRMLQGAGFMYAVSALMGSNIDLRTALLSIRDHSGAWLQWHIDEALDALREQGSAGKAMRLSIFDDVTSDELEMYAKTEKFALAIERISERYLERVTVSITRLAGRLRLFGMAAAGGLIAWLGIILYSVTMGGNTAF